MKRLLITGSRDYSDADLLRRELDDLRHRVGDFILIEGGASGADLLGKQWAIDRKVPYAEVPAQWSNFGRSAGPIRNEWMLSLEPGYAIAFPLGESRGTWDMVSRVQAAGIPYKVVGF